MQDERIKNILADAEVKPSRRVWRGIERRLDAAAAPAQTSWGWARWAGAALAFAALALGVFFVGTRSGQNPIPTYSNISVAPVAQAAAPEAEPEADVLIPVPARVAPGRAVRTAAVEIVSAEEHFAEESVSPAASERIAPAASEPAREPMAAVSEGKKPEETPAKVSEPDPFAVMAYEDSKAFKPRAKALYAQASIGGNDSDISFSATRARLASGTAINKTGIVETGESVFGIPFSLGLGVRFYVLPKLSFGTGLDYSFLSRTFDGQYQRVEDGLIVETRSGNVHHTMHYVGIPVNAYYDIVSARKVRFYVYGGGEVEFCVSNKYTLYSDIETVHRSTVNNPQWSVGAGLGVEFRLSDHLGLYLDPSARYYFHCDQPKNVRTERPFMANFDAGLRFDF